MIKVLLFFSLVNSQVIMIIDGQSKKPLQDVNLFSKSVGTTTDKNGFCSLDEFLNTEQIHVSMIGYDKVLLVKNNFPKILTLKPNTLPMVFSFNIISLQVFIFMSNEFFKLYSFKNTLNFLSTNSLVNLLCKASDKSLSVSSANCFNSLLSFIQWFLFDI